MRKSWNNPSLEVLDISVTLGGPGNAIDDSYCTNNQDFETQDGKSNASCMQS